MQGMRGCGVADHVCAPDSVNQDTGYQLYRVLTQDKELMFIYSKMIASSTNTFNTSFRVVTAFAIDITRRSNCLQESSS